jgi:hypothetical protein
MGQDSDDGLGWPFGKRERSHASVQFVLQEERPNKTRFETTTTNQKGVRAFDGVHGWKLRVDRGGSPDPIPYTPQEDQFRSWTLACSPSLRRRAGAARPSLARQSRHWGNDKRAARWWSAWNKCSSVN